MRGRGGVILGGNEESGDSGRLFINWKNAIMGLTRESKGPKGFLGYVQTACNETFLFLFSLG